MRKRLLFWIYPPYLITAVLCAAAFTAFTARTASSFFFELSSIELRQSALVVASAFSPLFEGPRPPDDAEVRAMCADLAKGTDLRISVIEPSGRVVADSKEDPGKLENHAGRKEVVEALSGKLGSGIRRSASTGITTVYEAVAVKGPSGEVRAVVRTSMPFSIIGERRTDLIINVLAFGVAAALAVSLLALLLTRGITDPIARLERGARDFASGKLEYRLRIEGPREIASLASVMNGMASELSERMEVIREQKRQAEAILFGMSEAVAVIDGSLAVIARNPAFDRLFAGGTGSTLLSLTGNAELCAFAEAALRAQGPLETLITVYGERSRRLRVGTSPIEGPRAVIVINDLTRMNRLETIRRDFTANVSHELKTPITAIRGALETLDAEADALPEGAGKFVEMALRNVKRLEDILADLLSLARIEEGEESGIETAQIALDPLVDSVIAEHDVRFRASGISIVREGEEGISIKGHAGLLKQALGNLIDNAIKYAAIGKEIRIRIERNGGNLRLSVSDKGPGIPDRDRSRLFERFYRVDKARSRDAGGTGLGLAIVRHIALAHGGSVELESRLGEGSTFSLILPLSD